MSLVAQYELDPGLLGVLTEYEEHRLRTNIQAGLSLYRIRVQFSLATIDSALDDLKAKARPHGEIITYLPTGGGGDIDTIELEILIASRARSRHAAGRDQRAERQRSKRSPKRDRAPPRHLAPRAARLRRPGAGRPSSRAARRRALPGAASLSRSP